MTGDPSTHKEPTTDDFLKGLNRSQIIEFLKTVDRVDDRLSVKKYDSYKPHDKGIDGGQIAFHKAAGTHIVRVVCTGNRWGKTTAAVQEIKKLATGTHEYRKMKVPNRGKFYGESFSWISDVLEPKLKEWIDPKLLDEKRPFEYNNQGGLTQINWACGSITRIGTYEQADRKSEGSNWDYVGFDEPPSHALWVACFRGIVDNKGIIWITATPLSEPWIFDELWLKGMNGQKPYVKCIRGMSSDNPNIPKDMLDLYFLEIPEEDRATRFSGEFSKLTGLVINTYNPLVSDIEEFDLDASYAIYEGIDPHSNKPHAVLWKAIDRDGFRYAVREMNFDGNMEEFAAAIVETRDDLERNGARVVRSVIDSAINQKDFISKSNVYRELVNELNKLKSKIIPKLALKGKGSLDNTITILKDLYRPSYLKSVSKEEVEEYVENNPYTTEIQGIDTVIKKHTKELEIKIPRQYIFRDRCKLYRRELMRYRWPKDSSGKDTVKPVDDSNEFISCDRYIEQLNPRWIELDEGRLIRIPVRGRS